MRLHMRCPVEKQQKMRCGVDIVSDPDGLGQACVMPWQSETPEHYLAQCASSMGGRCRAWWCASQAAATANLAILKVKLYTCCCNTGSDAQRPV